MITLESVNKLSAAEIRVLASLIGKQVHSVYANGVNLFHGRVDYSFTGPLNLALIPNDKQYYVFSYAFYENELGEEYYTTSIFSSTVPVQINTSADGLPQLPFASLLLGEFIINQIAVYGLEYEFVVPNEKHMEPKWKILKDDPGTPVRCIISTEHVLIFQTTAGEKMAIHPSGPLPWTFLSFDRELIHRIESGAPDYPFTHYRRKFIIG